MNLASHALCAAQFIDSFCQKLDQCQGLNGKWLHRMTEHLAIKVMEQTGKSRRGLVELISYKRVVAELQALGFTVKPSVGQDWYEIYCK